MFARARYVTNSSSSMHLIHEAIADLQNAHQLLLSAAYFEDREGQDMLPQLYELAAEIQAAVEGYDKHKQLCVEDYVKLLFKRNTGGLSP